MDIPRATGSLYVGDIPKDLANVEDTLYNLFVKLGMVISIKVCRDINTQASLGYGYVNYQNPSDAEEAIKQLNYHQIVPGREIRIMWSARDPSQRKRGTNNIFLKNIDPKMSNKQLHELGSQFGRVVSCKQATDERGIGRGYGFIAYETEEQANRAIAALNEMAVEDGANRLKATAFITRMERDREAEKTFKAVYAKNIRNDVTEEQLTALFSRYGKVESVFTSAHPKFQTKFAIICMETHEQAVKAIEALNDTTELAERDGKLFVTRLRRKAEIPAAATPFQNEGRNVYVKHLPDDTTEERLREIFSPFGAIESVSLQRDDRGTFRGFAFVCYENKESAAAAMGQLHMKHFMNNRPLYVQLAQTRDSRHRYLELTRRQFREQSLHAQMHPQLLMGPQMFYRMPIMGPGMMMPPHMRKGPRRQMIAAPPPPNRQMQQLMNMNQANRGPMRLQQSDFAHSLANMSPEERKNVLGEKLYQQINQINPAQAAKITGMLLEMDTNEILSVLEDHGLLRAKVDEAVGVLRAHEQQQQQQQQ